MTARPATFAIVLGIVSLALFGCGPKPDPKSLEGEDQAAALVVTFLSSVRSGDFETAKSLLYPEADYILRDQEHCRELFFGRESTGISVRGVTHNRYDSEWHIAVDVKISYGDNMKLLRFIVYPGNPPQLRGVIAQKPE